MTDYDRYPDEYIDELADDGKFVPEDGAKAEMHDMLSVMAILYAAAWLFQNGHITLREYMMYLDEAEADFDEAPPL